MDQAVEPWVRLECLKRVAREHRVNWFVETGTAAGATLEGMFFDMERLFSVELDPSFHHVANSRVGQYDKVSLSLGHSVPWLGFLMPRILVPCLVYLDAHYCGQGSAGDEYGTPILDELDAVFSAPIRHLIVVDDARGFGQWPGYPTIDEVAILAGRSGYYAKVTADEIELIPT